MKYLKPNTTVTRIVVSGVLRTIYTDSRTGNVRRRWWTKARVPGTVRDTRKPGGSSFRNKWEG